ncbi:hypothetical protein [Psychroflexus sediminis]|uniref:Cellobiose phosphorylase n=1 Tax=Psychroflexus sediminis TaxID=470826 RepID=A0A1G7TSB2_9FLAO|nr:hypothetical protein [Psychroflexus sediminis]SDG38233.1 hypothetical protein SAMN04488027_10128 [Psychroflexus sediminis]
MNKNQIIDNQTSKTSDLEQVRLNGEKFLKITNNDALRPFFMSIVSDSNHWMFISSNGGLTAGRRNAEYALFPYYTDDKITESAHYTGSKTIVKIHSSDQINYWEPFSNRFVEQYEITRNIYKNIYGDKLIFEEINHSLKLKFTYRWSTSDNYGFVKEAQLSNLDSKPVKLEVLDGLQNVLPAGVVSDLQIQSSNLVDAYKRSELDEKTGLGIFALSAVPVDKAEPSEALKANVVWSLGVENPTHLLSSLQLENFRSGKALTEETDVKAEKGAYFIHDTLELKAEAGKSWHIIADVNYNHASVVKLQQDLQKDNLLQLIEQDIQLGTEKLIQLNGAADGLQRSNDNLRDIRHYSNTMFNIMRGGIFDNNYQIERWDFKAYLHKANQPLAEKFSDEIKSLPEVFSLSDLKALAESKNDKDFSRLALEYLPLKFSRRHGDPSRPWNQFSINTKDDEGHKILDYEGNWRDIFQNWESLAHSYPEFIESMIYKFLNASTFDGYNPYRVTKDGFDWETIEPDDPWSYIGYWGDHQIIYLLKFLEFYEDYKPNNLAGLFNKSEFVYANVPYKIKSYQDILNDPKDTIEFDHKADTRIRKKRNEIGADGALRRDKKGNIIHVNFIEKILATALAKLSNFIPEAGIWMNTQRPEWNDANNALVGNGVSMVTLSYLRRFLAFFESVLEEVEASEGYEISEELADMFAKMEVTFKTYQDLTEGRFTDRQRKDILDELGEAASIFRTQVYTAGFSGTKTEVSAGQLSDFISSSLVYLEHAIEANKRTDNLYHAYNLMTLNEDGVSIDYLSEMLEGQVAVLSSGYLNSDQALSLLDALKQSALFRPDQYSYLLYPNKELKGFLERNTIQESSVNSSELLQKMIEDGNRKIIEKDAKGNYHFNANFNNGKKLKQALLNLDDEYYAALAESELDRILKIYEEVFNHKSFTGRSGTFYGYEGLGSIYWHMVSKLQLSVLETCVQAINTEASAEVTGRLLEHYYEINEGIGVHKSPKLYGAFPTDPYSHTPQGKGAQQPGMTGQVKEDILSRFGELGVSIKKGKLQFKPHLLRKTEFLDEKHIFRYVDVANKKHQLQLEKNSLGFTFCQVPILYTRSTQNKVEVEFSKGGSEQIDGLQLPKEISQEVFDRSGKIKMIHVQVEDSFLK